MSSQHKEKLRLISKGKKLSNEHKQILLNFLTGRKHTAEAKLKMSLSHSGKPSGRLGIKHTDETREKMVSSHKGFTGLKHSEEAKKNMRDSWKIRRAKYITKGERNAMQEEAKTTKEISTTGAVKNEWLQGWGYKLGTPESEQAWEAKLALDNRVANIRNPNKPHGRLYDLPSYQSPITGKWIDGRVARREDLARSGCVEYDDSMKTEQIKRHAAEDAALDKKVDEIVEKTIYEMPTEKREKLATELEHSDIEVTRT